MVEGFVTASRSSLGYGSKLFRKGLCTDYMGSLLTGYSASYTESGPWLMSFSGSEGRGLTISEQDSTHQNPFFAHMNISSLALGKRIHTSKTLV